MPLLLDESTARGAGTAALVPKLPLGGGTAAPTVPPPSEEVRQLHRTASAVQYDPNDLNEDLNDLAWNQLRLSDASYLPLERTRLLQFLMKWGSFPHIQGGHCKACAGVDRPPDTNPLLLASAPPTPRFAGDSPRRGNNSAREASAAGYGLDMNGTAYGGGGGGTKGPGGLVFKSRLLPTVDLTAQWVFESRPVPRPDVPPHMRKHVPDRFSRTHAIVAHSEAIYCKWVMTHTAQQRVQAWDAISGALKGKRGTAACGQSLGMLGEGPKTVRSTAGHRVWPQ